MFIEVLLTSTTVVFLKLFQNINPRTLIERLASGVNAIKCQSYSLCCHLVAIYWMAINGVHLKVA